MPYENYLFKDYHLKSGMAIWILALITSGRYLRGPRNLTGHKSTLKLSFTPTFKAGDQPILLKIWVIVGGPSPTLPFTYRKNILLIF